MLLSNSALIAFNNQFNIHFTLVVYQLELCFLLSDVVADIISNDFLLPYKRKEFNYCISISEKTKNKKAKLKENQWKYFVFYLTFIIFL